MKAIRKGENEKQLQLQRVMIQKGTRKGTREEHGKGTKRNTSTYKREHVRVQKGIRKDRKGTAVRVQKGTRQGTEGNTRRVQKGTR